MVAFCCILEGSLIFVFLSLSVFFLYRFFKFPKVSGELINNFLQKTSQETYSPPLIAHRGGGHEAPENTIAAFKLAKSNGADGVEFDLDFTNDGVAVIFHDSTVDRTTNGYGNVKDFKFEDIRRLDASCQHHRGKEFPGETIPTLEETIQVCLQLGLKMYIDVKASDSPARAARTLKEMFEKYNLYNEAIVCSFFPQVIYMVRRFDSKILTALTWRPWVISYSIAGKRYYKEWWIHLCASLLDKLWEYILHTLMWDFLGVSAFLCQKNQLSRNYLDKWSARSVQVVVWTVNHPAEKDFFTAYMKCPVITDCVLRDITAPTEQIC